VGEGFTDPDDPYDPDYDNIGPRLAAAWTPGSGKTVLRGGFGVYHGPGQMEDRFQSLKNAITRYRATSADVSTLQYPFTQADEGGM
jgi:hypothetical protein